MIGNMSRWVLTESGWRMQALSLYVKIEHAMMRSLGERNLIVWHPDTQPNLNCYFYGGAELFTSEVLELEEFEREIVRLRPKTATETLESVAEGVLLDQAISNRDAFIDRIVARKQQQESINK